MPTGNPRISFVVSNQAFDVTVNGLIPLSRHFLYFERQRQADSTCSPRGGSVGQALISDLNGKLSFTYFYNSGLPTETSSLEQAQTLANAVAGTKELIILNFDQPTIDTSFDMTAISFARTYIRIQVFLPSQTELEPNPIVPIAGPVGNNPVVGGGGGGGTLRVVSV